MQQTGFSICHTQHTQPYIQHTQQLLYRGTQLYTTYSMQCVHCSIITCPRPMQDRANSAAMDGGLIKSHTCVRWTPRVFNCSCCQTDAVTHALLGCTHACTHTRCTHTMCTAVYTHKHTVCVHTHTGSGTVPVPTSRYLWYLMCRVRLMRTSHNQIRFLVCTVTYCMVVGALVQTGAGPDRS